MVDASIVRIDGTDGWLVMENESLKAEIYLLKGAETIGLTHKPTGVQVIRQVDGYQDAYRRIAQSRDEYTDNFMNEYTTGAWFEMFPHAGIPTGADRYDMPQHGDLRTARFTAKIVEKSPSKAVASVQVTGVRAPYRLRRAYTLEEGSPMVTVSEEAINESGRPFPITWGHHPSFSLPFIDGATLEVPAKTIVDEKGTRFPYPKWDQTDIRTAMAAEGDAGYRMLFLTDLTEGWFVIRNTSLGVSLKMEFDRELFPWVWYYDTRGGEGGMTNLMALEFVSGLPYAMDKNRMMFNDKLATSFSFGFI